MSDIEWTEKTWNAIVGCSPAKGSEQGGCRECYAQGEVHRFKAHYDRPGVVRLSVTNRNALTFLPKDPATGKSLGKGAKWTGEVWLLPHALGRPLMRREKTTWFVNSISDMFHESIVGCDEGRRFIAAMFGIMAATPQHTYQILTKRPERALEWYRWAAEQTEEFGVSVAELCVLAANDVLREASDGEDGLWRAADELMDRWTWASDGAYGFEALDDDDAGDIGRRISRAKRYHADAIDVDAWPLLHAWVGVSVEDQRLAGERIPALAKIPAAVRFLSCEPLLGPVDLGLEGAGDGRPDWVIAGGESGPKARPCEVHWLRSIVDQCRAAGVAAFVKQLGARPVALCPEDLGDNAWQYYETEHGPGPFCGPYLPGLRDAKGGDMSEWPEDLRVREMPGAR